MSRAEVGEIIDSLAYEKRVKTIFKEKILSQFNSIESLINANQKQFAATHPNTCGPKCLSLWDEIREVAFARKRQEKADELAAAKKEEAKRVEHERTTFKFAEVKALAAMMDLCGMAEIDIVGIKDFFRSAKIDIGKMMS